MTSMTLYNKSFSCKKWKLDLIEVSSVAVGNITHENVNLHERMTSMTLYNKSFSCKKMETYLT